MLPVRFPRKQSNAAAHKNKTKELEDYHEKTTVCDALGGGDGVAGIISRWQD